MVTKGKIKNYHFKDFNIDKLKKIKKQKNLKIAIVVPVINEEKTIGKLIDNINLGCKGIFDDILVFDSGSTDNSEKICIKKGINFIKDKDIAQEAGFSEDSWKSGKGFNLWASVYYCLDNYDIICWIDADLKAEPRYIYGILGPMILEDNIRYTKGRYYRPETDSRVTRILVEPLMSMFFPETRDFVDPLCGLFGGRVEFLSKLPFYTGYSVDSAILIHALNSTNKENIAQIYLGELKNREHDNLRLGRMSASIAYTLLEIADERNILKINKGKISPDIIQQSTINGIEFNPVKMNFVDYKLPTVEKTKINKSIYNIVSITQIKLNKIRENFFSGVEDLFVVN